MSKHSDREKDKEEQKEREKVRKEKLAGFFYNMALATFSVWVLGVVLSMYQNAEVSQLALYVLVGGGLVTIGLAVLGNNELK